MTPQQGFPSIAAPLTDPKTGRILQVWLQLLVTLWNRTGQGPGINIDDLMILMSAPEGRADIAAFADEIAALALTAPPPQRRVPEVGLTAPIPQKPGPEAGITTWDALSRPRRIAPPEGFVPPLRPRPVPEADIYPFTPKRAPAPFPVVVETVGLSPFTYLAPADGVVVINGVTTNIDFSRDGTNFTAYPTPVVTVCAGDITRVTYAGAAPDLTFYGV